jgi:hypothetical protein
MVLTNQHHIYLGFAQLLKRGVKLWPQVLTWTRIDRQDDIEGAWFGDLKVVGRHILRPAGSVPAKADDDHVVVGGVQLTDQVLRGEGFPPRRCFIVLMR